MAAHKPCPPTLVLPQATSAEEQLRLLSAARRASQRAVHQATTVDARMYEQLLNAQTRLNKRLSETNAYMYHLEETVARCHEDLMAAHQLLKQVGTGTSPMILVLCSAAAVQARHAAVVLIRMCAYCAYMPQAGVNALLVQQLICFCAAGRRSAWSLAPRGAWLRGCLQLCALVWTLAMQWTRWTS